MSNGIDIQFAIVSRFPSEKNSVRRKVDPRKGDRWDRFRYLIQKHDHDQQAWYYNSFIITFNPHILKYLHNIFILVTCNIDSRDGSSLRVSQWRNYNKSWNNAEAQIKSFLEIIRQTFSNSCLRLTEKR